MYFCIICCGYLLLLSKSVLYICTFSFLYSNTCTFLAHLRFSIFPQINYKSNVLCILHKNIGNQEKSEFHDIFYVNSNNRTEVVSSSCQCFSLIKLIFCIECVSVFYNIIKTRPQCGKTKNLLLKKRFHEDDSDKF